MRVCENCRDYMYPNSEEGRRAKYCSACKVVTYCSKRCQEAHWSQHKGQCAQLRQQAEQSQVPEEQVHGPSRGGSGSSGGPGASSGGRASGSGAGGSGGAGEPRLVRPMCGLCGNRKGPFEVTECCGRIVCDDQDDYVLMSYGRNSCSRNHSRYTLCHAHYSEQHAGRWQDCSACRGKYNALTFYGYGSNHPGLPSRCNFPDQVLNERRPPLPRCSTCHRRVDTNKDGYSSGAGGLRCLPCIGM